MKANYRVEICAEGYETTDFEEYFAAKEYYNKARHFTNYQTPIQTI